jgi:hypothetical protein
MPSMRRNNQKVEFIELVNSEGPILIAYKKKGQFTIVDEDGEQVDFMSDERMYEFIEGKYSIRDSRDRVWTYPTIHDDMKVEREDLITFVGASYKISRPELREKFLGWMEANASFAKEWEETVDRVCDLLEENPHLIRKA